jgi:hypothetical protein
VQGTLGTGSGEKVLAVGCPFCKSMLQSTPSAGEDTSVVIKDVAELLWEGVQRARPAAESQQASTDPQQTSYAAPTPVVTQSEVLPIVEAPPQSAPSPASTPQRTVAEPAITTVPDVAAAPVLPSDAQPAARKKWAPKPASAPTEVAATPTATEIATPVAEAASTSAIDAPPAPTPQRKKWAPKAEATLPPTPQAAPESAASTPPLTGSQEPAPTTAPPARKKWQPGGPK